jgi:hypothetical protein
MLLPDPESSGGSRIRIAAIVSAAVSAFLISSIQGASVENAIIQAAISGALAGIASYATKSYKFADGAARWAAAKGTAKALSFGANMGINAAMGNDLPFSGGPGATNPQALGAGNVMTAAKVSMVIAMNVGAAAGEGANSGKMLLLAASAATGSLTGTGGSSRQGSRQSITRTLASVARQFMTVLAKAVVMKLTEQNSDDNSLSLGSSLVQLAAGMASRVMAASAQRSSAQRSESASEAGERNNENKNDSANTARGMRDDRSEGPNTGAAQVRTATLSRGSDSGAEGSKGANYGSVTEQLSRTVTAALGAAIDAIGSAAGYLSSSNSSSASSLTQSNSDKGKDALDDGSYNLRSESDSSSGEKRIDTSHMATGTAEKDSSGVMYFGEREKAGGAGDYNDKKNILEGIGIKVDNNILEGFFGAKAIADMKELLGAQKIDFDTVLGAKVNGKEMALFFKDDMLVAAGMVSASGQKEVRTFAFKLDDDGKVSVASGKIFREIAGKYVEVGAFVYAVKGSKEYMQAMNRAEGMIQSGEALAKVKQADAVYTETDTAGNMTRRIYMKTDAAGGAVVLAAELKGSNGKFKLLTYDEGIANPGKDGLMAKGKIYEQEASGKYGKEAAGSFEIREMTGTANLSINKSIAQVLSLGQNSRIVYKEQMKSGSLREISMNKETGQLEYVYSKDANGTAQVIAFGNVKNQTVNGVQVTNFNSLSKEQQNDVLASLPVMDNRDPATITAKLVAMQNELLQARLQKLAAERGWKLDTEKGQIFMKIPGGAGIQVMRMGEDRDGELDIEGRMLMASTDGAGFVPSIMRQDLMDGVIQVEKEESFAMTARCAREEGILVGISTGAVLAAVAKKLPELPAGARVLTFCYDTGERYLSIEGLFG